MAIEVFARYELKFALDEEQYRSVLREIEKRMVPDAYSMGGETYTISNVYYDTPDNYLISTAVRHDGTYRYKIRLRTYDCSLQTAFLEIKKKFNGLTSKRRTSMFIDDVAPMLNQGIFPQNRPFMNVQVAREICEIGKVMTLEPKTVVSYDRRAYFSKNPEDSDLRITFDTNIRSRRENLDLRMGNSGTLLRNDGRYIMEVKVARSVPVWVSDMLSRYEIRRIRYSKYGEDYKKYVINSRPTTIEAAKKGKKYL